MSQQKLNQNRGAAFERYCADRVQVLKLPLVVKRIERTERKYASLFDIEFLDFPQLSFDCKFTEGTFTLAEKLRLHETVETKYQDRGVPVTIFGEKHHKPQLRCDNIHACMWSSDFIELVCGFFNTKPEQPSKSVVRTLLLVPYDQFLLLLANLKELP